MIRSCVAGEEANSIMWHCHSSAYGGPHCGERTAAKILHSGFWWPTIFKDCQEFVRRCYKCQRTCNISKRNEMPLTGIIEIEPFDCWGIDFMGPSLTLTLYFIFWFVLIMLLSGLKWYLVLLMMPKILSIFSTKIFSLGLEPLEFSINLR